MTIYVLLNGKNVPASEIDPSKHRYIGMFRPAENPFARASGNVLCPCGQILMYQESLHEHFRGGCFDTQQYADIERVPS
jgi:hypothetical protein